MPEIIIRDAKVTDGARLLEIYKPYVEKTAITFEYEVPSLEEFTQRIEKVQTKYPYLVAELEGKIMGYAYVGQLKSRAAYGWSVETSIYVDGTQKQHGLGRKLYEALEEILSKQGVTNLYACIAYPVQEDEHLTYDSVCFHEKLGYKLNGHFHHCAYKFERWYDMVWMEKFIGDHVSPQPSVTAYRAWQKD